MNYPHKLLESVHKIALDHPDISQDAFELLWEIIDRIDPKYVNTINVDLWDTSKVARIYPQVEIKQKKFLILNVGDVLSGATFSISQEEGALRGYFAVSYSIHADKRLATEEYYFTKPNDEEFLEAVWNDLRMMNVPVVDA